MRSHRGDGGVRALDQGDQALVGGALQVRGETGDVMRMPDYDGARATLPRHGGGCLERTQRQPGAGKPLTVPGLDSAPTRDDRRFAAPGHPVVHKLVEIRREQGEAVRGVPEQIAIDEHVGDVAGHVAAHLRALEQRARECAQIRRSVAEFGIRAHGVDAVRPAIDASAAINDDSNPACDFRPRP